MGTFALGSYRGEIGKPCKVPVRLNTGASGLTLATLPALSVVNDLTYVGAPDVDLDMTLTEVSVSFPGYYVLEFLPDREGYVFIEIYDGVDVYQYGIEISHPIGVADASLEGDHVVTVTQGATPVPGATVRVFNAWGTLLVARGITDSLGKVSFPLAIGTYQVRVSKDGYDFSAINPSVITVIPNESVTPRIDEIVPPAAAIGDTIMLRGAFFDLEDSEVVFGTAATVPAGHVDRVGEAILVEVPPGLTLMAIPVRVRKPDPSNPGSFLYSNVATLVQA